MHVSLDTALDEMAARGVSTLAVVADHGGVLGALSIGNVVEILGQKVEQLGLLAQLRGCA